MFSRRDFMKTAAVTTATASIVEQADASQETLRRPLKAEPRRRTVFARPNSNGGLILYSDGAPEPRKLIREDALERAFGRGAGRFLLQPDHWRMIDEGWFREEDLFEPLDPYSQEYLIWHANYRPEVEAHDLLIDIFGKGLLPGGGVVDDLGLAFAEHPCTPRYATVVLRDLERLPLVCKLVAARTDWIVIDPSCLPS